MGDERQQSRLERCRKRVEEHPESAAAHFNLGLACTQLGRVTQAEQAYRKALEIDPENTYARRAQRELKGSSDEQR